MNERIRNAVNDIKDELEQSYLDKGLLASGRYGKELEVEEVSESRIRITAPHYVYQMENGRNAGKQPPVSAIRQWITDKNENAGTDIPLSAAFAIAKVIGRQGISVPNRFNEGGVVGDVLTDARIRELCIAVAQSVKIEITKILKNGNI